ncbi:hypothetical protein PFICI_13880 [Pestalotiopsis fici W106-1]|uniref:Fido domain-containing protein n=1 Tax=Pestalotiopsis fici (strain W106-1 / CGMCC3.15140) TaxID=1229662 RepID=W3WJR6_PESFW|nr:uncharacterized protein PFICI_13880 [Pestalotiopsis fici W106-1]ETS74014.1 hypothetical protein PFICI_13880 [Pestalotiopsis fici W106-1]
MKRTIPDIAKTLAAAYALQSVKYENNQSTTIDMIKAERHLTARLFNVETYGLHKFCEEDLLNIEIPRAEPSSPDMVELENHIVASRWIAENAIRHPGTPGLNEREVQILQTITCKGTTAEQAHLLSWGKRIALGDYRVTPIQVRSNPLRVFPYPQEVPACIKRFFAWRDKAHTEGILHPLVLACQAQVYFVHVHPFLDGNGRVSRMISHDYMTRQGYLPAIIPHLDRYDHLRMISNASDGNPREFVTSVIVGQLDALRKFHRRSKS